MKVEVTMPEEYMGDVIGDVNARRGRIEGMEDIGGGKMVKAYVPLAEMFGYSTDLRSRTQGRVTTPCSSRSTSRYRRAFRRRSSLRERALRNNPTGLFPVSSCI